MGFWDVMTVVGFVIGGILLFAAFLGGMSAPQQGAVAAIGIGVAALPYFMSAMFHRVTIRRAMAASFKPAPPAP